MNTTAVIIARFQTPRLHDGHRYILNTICAKHNKVVLVLGVTQVKGSRKDPLDFYTREKMVKAYDANIIVLSLSDTPSDAVWSANLDQLLSSTFPSERFTLYGSRDSFLSVYTGRNHTEELPEVQGLSGTQERDAFADKVLATEDFRIGVNYAYHNTYPKVHPAVDIALVNEAQVLLGRKHQTCEWRFPGGFTDPEDVSYEAAALREMKEECGDIETGNISYIASMKVDDWRYRGEVDKIFTSFYLAEYISGEPKASDDLAEVKWFDLSELATMREQNMIAKEHLPLIKALQNKFNL